MPVRERVLQTWRFVKTADGDARHAERTADILRGLGAHDEVVLAGLWHDVGKPADTRLWHRIAGVLLAALAPSLRGWLARGDSTFSRYLDHARRGAEQARHMGLPERAVRLIERHHEAPTTEDERLLQRADREAIPR